MNYTLFVCLDFWHRLASIDCSSGDSGGQWDRKSPLLGSLYLTSFSLAGVWFYVVGSACFWCSIVAFQKESEEKCFRMGITLLKIVICRGKSSVLWSKISFYGDATKFLTIKPTIYDPKWQAWRQLSPKNYPTLNLRKCVPFAEVFLYYVSLFKN